MESDPGSKWRTLSVEDGGFNPRSIGRESHDDEGFRLIKRKPGVLLATQTKKPNRNHSNELEKL